MAITWDANFEALPKDTDEAKYGAEKIRDLKLAISERLELEMNFKTGTQPLIKAGKAAVIYIGTTAEIDALTGMSVGAFPWDTTLKVLKRYSTTWDILDIDHGALSGLADDDHTQYLNLAKASQELTESLAVTDLKTIDGRDLSVDGAKLDSLNSKSQAYNSYPETIYNTTSTTWVDMDSFSYTSLGKDVLVSAHILGSGYNPNVYKYMHFQLLFDATVLASIDGLLTINGDSTGGTTNALTLSGVAAGFGAGVHTIKIQFRSPGGTRYSAGWSCTVSEAKAT